MPFLSAAEPSWNLAKMKQAASLSMHVRNDMSTVISWPPSQSPSTARGRDVTLSPLFSSTQWTPRGYEECRGEHSCRVPLAKESIGFSPCLKMMAMLRRTLTNCATIFPLPHAAGHCPRAIHAIQQSEDVRISHLVHEVVLNLNHQDLLLTPDHSSMWSATVQ